MRHMEIPSRQGKRPTPWGGVRRSLLLAAASSWTRVHKGLFMLDLRCLEDEASFLSQLPLELQRGPA